MDNAFLIDAELNFQLLIEKIAGLKGLYKITEDEERKNKIHNEIMHLEQYANQFDLLTISGKKISVQYLNILSDQDYVKTYNMIEEISILDLVEKDFRCL